MKPLSNISLYGPIDTFQNTFINQPSLSYSSFDVTLLPNSFSTSCSNDLFFRTPHSYNNTTTTPSINPYETTKTFQNTCLNDSFFFETQHSYNNNITIAPNIGPYETIVTFQDMFINQSPSLSSSSSFIYDEPEPNNEQNITSTSNSFPISCSNKFSFFETQYSYNNVPTITPNIDGTIETYQNMFINQSLSSSSPSFIYDELEPQNIISSSSSPSNSSNDSFFFETQHSYNIIPNINPYGSVETFQNTFIDQSSFVHDKPMPNDE
ncbi:8207_t:CDS:2 [Dentiscutata erythropus]|uniref:8207_t:CDS:1 n=1 Tax=Dentiscutata erythropus TaxID=1348616 RepID=A0A9N8YX41_9GLOM|nr:8207_t:CDS:2 [Dentiscutata erythropus]